MNVRTLADTNLFLRYLTNDVPEQAEAVDALLQETSEGDVVLVATVMTMAEIVWTLESYYNLPRQAVHDRILAILNTPGLEVEASDLVLSAIFWYLEARVDFIDAYNYAWAIERGLQAICTFDQRHFSRFEGIHVFTPGEN